MEAMEMAGEERKFRASHLAVFRAKLREDEIRPNYSGVFHIGLVSIASILGVVGSIFFALSNNPIFSSVFLVIFIKYADRPLIVHSTSTIPAASGSKPSGNCVCLLCLSSRFFDL